MFQPQAQRLFECGGLADLAIYDGVPHVSHQVGVEVNARRRFSFHGQ
jgi:hypothetical protein